MNEISQATETQAAFARLAEEIEGFYEGIRDLPVAQPVDLEAIRAHLGATYGSFASAQPVIEVIGDVARMLREWNTHVTHPRNFGLFNPSVHLASVYADTLTAAFNPQLAVWTHAAAANEIERMVLRFFLECLGFDPDTSAANFTTGGAEANLSALTVALTAKFPTYGMDGAPGNAVFYASVESHGSLGKIAHQTGIGRRALHAIPVDEHLRLDVDALRRQIAADRAAGLQPFLVVGTAGTTPAGIIDPLGEIAGVCQVEGLWFHVDAAYGGAARLSSELVLHMNGIQRADSVTWDAHKWLSVPLGAGMFFCKHRKAVEQTYAIHASYMPSGEAVDPYVTTIQWSRRLIGLKVFMVLATLGIDGVVDLIDRQTQMGDLLRGKLKERGWQVVNRTFLPVICFTHPALQGDDARLAALLKRLVDGGEVWISQVSLSTGVTALRACITSFRTDEADIDALVDALERALEGESANG